MTATSATTATSTPSGSSAASRRARSSGVTSAMRERIEFSSVETVACETPSPAATACCDIPEPRILSTSTCRAIT